MSGTMIVIDADGHRDERTLKAAPKLEEDSVRQVGVISGVGPGRHDQAALGVI